MKLLLDTCVWGGSLAEFIEAGHDVIWTGNWAQDPGDEHILAYAYENERILITQDKDFGELAIVHNNPHCGIIRLVDIPVKKLASYCQKALNTYSDDLHKGAIVIISESRMRIRHTTTS